MSVVVDENQRRAAFAAAQRIFRRAVDPDTFLATFFLPRAKREAVLAVGAFAHLTVAAIASAAGDSCGGGGACGPTPGGDVLALVRDRIDAAFAGRVELPLPQFRDDQQWTLLAVTESAARFEIPQSAMHDFLDGLVAGAAVTRYATWRSLGEHCRRTGGNVALLMTAILGATHSDAGQFAMQVGQAAQLTRILRDLKRDLIAGRVLLPLEDLTRVRCGEKDLLSFRETDAFARLIRLEVARARELFRSGAEGLCWLAGDGSRMAAAAYVTSQLAALDAIDRAPAEVLRGGLRISTARRLRRLPDAWRLAKRQAAEPLPRLN